MTKLLVLLFTLLSSIAPAEVIQGKVVGISDGDTLTLLTAEKTQVKIRLEGIDSPEKKQEFGTKARQALSKLVAGKIVTAKVSKKDRYRRSIATVYLGQTNVNLWMASNGWAWHYTKYSKDKTLAAAQSHAKGKKAGLWAGYSPMPPWEFRDLKEQKPAKVETKTEGITGYWLNSGSNTRHNSRCRWYGKTKLGRYCGAKDGKAGECCGGLSIPNSSFYGKHLPRSQ